MEILNEGINDNFCKSDMVSTGICAEIILDNTRSQCANLGATRSLSVTHINENQSSLDNA